MGQHYVGRYRRRRRDQPADPGGARLRADAGRRLRLVGVEYVVFKADWDTNALAARRQLFNQTFMLDPRGEPLRTAGLLRAPRLDLAANPSGMFEDWNPKVTCRGNGDPGLTLLTPRHADLPALPRGGRRLSGARNFGKCSPQER